MTKEINIEKGKPETAEHKCHDPETCPLDPETCMANSSLGKAVSGSDTADDCMGRSLDQLSKAFMASARRWEMIVYPSLVAFIVLAGYGFFLIYSLTMDASKISENMDKIAVQMNSISKNMVVMTQTVDSQSSSMQEMVLHMRGMNMSMNQMRYDFSVLNNSVSRPMSFMNTFMPW
jgi:hypothetical protein